MVLKVLRAQDDEILYSAEVGNSIENHSSLLSFLLNLGIPMTFSCGGLGTCGTCRILVVQGSLPTANELESSFWTERGYPVNHPERLSCQINPRDLRDGSPTLTIKIEGPSKERL